MSARVLMLRGINIGPNRRIAMAELRALLTGAGYEDVRTYVQSGNVVVRSRQALAGLEEAVRGLISDRFGLDVPVVARTRDQLEAVVALDPLRDVVTEHKLYQVTFLSAALDPPVVESLRALVGDSEALAIEAREVYTWHAAGVARSKLASALAAKRLGVTATARNWTTVTTLLAMAKEADGVDRPPK